MTLGGRSYGFFGGYGFVVGWVACRGGALHLFDEGDDAGETLFAGGFVGGRCGVVCVGGWVFAGAHEAVACAVVDDGVIFLPAAFMASVVAGTVAPIRASLPA